MLTFLLFGLQKWHSTKFDSALCQKLISTIRELLKASFKPLPQGFGAISGGSRGTNHQYLYFMREWEGEQLDLRQFLIFSTGYYVMFRYKILFSFSFITKTNLRLIISKTFNKICVTTVYISSK